MKKTTALAVGISATSLFSGLVHANTPSSAQCTTSAGCVNSNRFNLPVVGDKGTCVRGDYLDCACTYQFIPSSGTTAWICDNP